MADEPLLEHLERSFGLSRTQADRIVREVVRYYDESPEGFIRRRHRELQSRGVPNARAFEQIAEELAARPVAGPRLSERQIRRVIYG